MPGTAKSYQSSKITIGPGDFWMQMAVPAAGARQTLHTDGTPESAANPSAVHMGLTDKGNKVTYDAQIQTFGSDELTSPVLAKIETESLMIEGEMIQAADLSLLDQLILGGAKATGSGYEEITLGGNTTVTGQAVTLVAPTVADATKFSVVTIYSAYNSAGVSFDLTRTDIAKVPYKFEGLQISTRAQGDRLGNLWKTA